MAEVKPFVFVKARTVGLFFFVGKPKLLKGLFFGPFFVSSPPLANSSLLMLSESSLDKSLLFTGRKTFLKVL